MEYRSMTYDHLKRFNSVCILSWIIGYTVVHSVYGGIIVKEVINEG